MTYKIQLLKDKMLQRLLRHGFVLPNDPERGLVILLRGPAGTGKSTLALQILDQVNPEAPRFYCTLEQSVTDLGNKLVSMRMGQVLQQCMCPDFEPKVDSPRFTYDSVLAGKLLEDSMGPQLRKKICDLLKQASGLPLYGEPSQSDIEIKAKLQASMVAEVHEWYGGMRSEIKEVINQAKGKFISNDVYEREATKIKKALRESLPEALVKEVDTIVARFNGEINNDWGHSITVLEEHLRELVDRSHFFGIRIRDGSRRDNRGLPEGPFEGRMGRVLQADRILEEPCMMAEEAKKTKNRDVWPIVVLDGLSLLSHVERQNLEMQELVERLRYNFQMGIIVYEPDGVAVTSLDHHTDMVIELAQKRIEQPLSYLIHEMCISKARYQDSALGNHQFKIRQTGLAFFPSLHFQVHHYNYMELELNRSVPDAKSPERASPRIPCDRGSLLDLIFSPMEGESIVLLGSRNSFKTQLTLDFLACGNWGKPTSTVEKELGLLISLIDNAPSSEGVVLCPFCQDRAGAGSSCPHCCDGAITHVSTFTQRPGYITPAEFFYYISERISKNKNEIQRLVFWDLTQMDYRFPLFREDKMFLPTLMDFFKTKRLRSVFMGAGNAENTQAASAMADHVVFCWRSHSHWHKNPLDRNATAAPCASLMLYIDRTPTGKMSRTLYALPIFENGEVGWAFSPDELCKLVVSQTELSVGSAGDSKGVNKPNFRAVDRDLDEIRRISTLQGVP